MTTKKQKLNEDAAAETAKALGQTPPSLLHLATIATVCHGTSEEILSLPESLHDTMRWHMVSYQQRFHFHSEKMWKVGFPPLDYEPVPREFLREHPCVYCAWKREGLGLSCQLIYHAHYDRHLCKEGVEKTWDLKGTLMSKVTFSGGRKDGPAMHRYFSPTDNAWNIMEGRYRYHCVGLWTRRYEESGNLRVAACITDLEPFPPTITMDDCVIPKTVKMWWLTKLLVIPEDFTHSAIFSWRWSWNPCTFDLRTRRLDGCTRHITFHPLCDTTDVVTTRSEDGREEEEEHVVTRLVVKEVETESYVHRHGLQMSFDVTGKEISREYYIHGQVCDSQVHTEASVEQPPKLTRMGKPIEIHDPDPFMRAMLFMHHESDYPNEAELIKVIEGEAEPTEALFDCVRPNQFQSF